ncbi:beta/alpha barrel domain-containing protein [Mycolicibacterium grossiae]|uniref:Ribulose phosphate epimerase n=1 Tax=Mycolicibacterium grossiae TaxID=1552759 RepID=A0A1E8Q4S6_9MYCO|nr:ribulose phosphate epimerase [Mycolicibacterium grossiae]OFJ53628.1 ribulose phosphate epimerase [Mycolicibacterium grossiae]QEM46757.1 ribulose phosphate epimerase [Mycolicibacterium grossiae]
MTVVLSSWHHRYPGMIAGSVYAAAPGTRPATAAALAEAGVAVHVDVMAASEGLPAGVGLDELRDIARVVHPRRTDVHLIGSPRFVDDVLADVLATSPARVILPWAAFDEDRAGTVRRAGAHAWIALWDEWDGVTGDPGWPARPDGVLAMLIEPGTQDRCRIGRLNLVTACATREPELPVMVDGGVTEEIAPLCVTAGAQQLVVGRALLTADRKEAM